VVGRVEQGPERFARLASAHTHDRADHRATGARWRRRHWQRVRLAIAVQVDRDERLAGPTVERDTPAPGQLDDHAPPVIARYRIVPEAPNRARLDLLELLEPVGQASEPGLEHPQRLGVLEAAGDQLLLLVAADARAPQRIDRR